MKLASGAELVVWAIIAIVVAISKGLGKLNAPSSTDEATNEPAEPLSPPPIRKRFQNTRPPQARYVEERREPPVVRPVVDEPLRPEPPRDFRELLARFKLPAPVPPPVQPKVAPPPAPPRKHVPLKRTEPAVTTAPPVSDISKNSQWVTALRDPSNLRNIIIAAEIIGPPRGA